MPSVGCFDGIAAACQIVGKIGLGNQASVLLHPRRSLFGEISAIKVIDSVICHAFQCISQIRLHEPFASLSRRSIVFQKHLLATRKFSKGFARTLQDGSVRGSDGESFAGSFRSGQNERREILIAEFAHCLLVSL